VYDHTQINDGRNDAEIGAFLLFRFSLSLFLRLPLEAFFLELSHQQGPLNDAVLIPMLCPEVSLTFVPSKVQLQHFFYGQSTVLARMYTIVAGPRHLTSGSITNNGAL
jgi:hypothetical protein